MSSMGSPANPFDAQFDQARRRQMMAQMLSGQHVAGNSPWAGLANAASSMAGAYMGHQGDEMMRRVLGQQQPAGLAPGQGGVEPLTPPPPGMAPQPQGPMAGGGSVPQPQPTLPQFQPPMGVPRVGLPQPYPSGLTPGVGGVGPLARPQTPFGFGGPNGQLPPPR